MSKRKSERSENYLEEEKFALVNIVKSHVNVIENKKTDSNSHLHKRKAWDSILAEYNHQYPNRTAREMRSIKDLWKRLKIRTRKEIAQWRKSTKKTGGGDADAGEPDPLIQLVADIMKEDLSAVTNIYDDDADSEGLHDESSSYSKRICIESTDDASNHPETASSQITPGLGSFENPSEEQIVIMRRMEHVAKMKLYDLEAKVANKQLQVLNLQQQYWEGNWHETLSQ